MGTELGKIVKDRMHSLNLTYERTAELAGITKDYVYKIIQGDRNPEEETVLKLAEALQLDKKELLFVSYRDRAPKEAKGYFGKAIPGTSKILLDALPRPEYIEDTPENRKFIEILKKAPYGAKERIESKTGFTEQIGAALNEYVNLQLIRFRDLHLQKQQDKIFKELDSLFEKVTHRKKKELPKVEKLAMSLPLMKPHDTKDPLVQILIQKKPHENWTLSFEKTEKATPFVFEAQDEAMLSLIQPKDYLICHTKESSSSFHGKLVITKVKELGVVIRNCHKEEKKFILTALNSSFPPLVLSASDIEWIHPITGIYRTIQ